MGRSGSYDALSPFLRQQSSMLVHMTFKDVENVVGRSLPPSAFRYQAWWANNPEGHSHCRAWIDAGWKTESIDLGRKTLTFRKIVRQTAKPEDTVPSSRGGIRIIGRLRGTVTILGGVAEPAGEVWNAEQGIL